MRIYILHTQGKITEMADAGFGITFEEKEIRFNHPNEELVEITEEDSKKLEGKLEYFKYENGMVVEKSIAEKGVIDDEKMEWLENNTIAGLKKQIDDIKLKLTK